VLIGLYLASAALSTPAASDTVTSCARIAARYQSVASAHPGEAPLTALAGVADSGVGLSTTRVALHSAEDLGAWARAQQPPFEVGAELSAALDQLFTHVSAPLLEQLPGQPFYSVSSIAGSAGCYESLYFVVDAGRARPSVAPPGFDDEGGACGVRRIFGRIDDAPALFQESYDRSPRMTSELIVASWSAAGVSGSCGVGFSFAPRFRPETLNPWPRACSAPDCGELQRAAFEVAAEVQRDPRAARRAFEAKLSAAESEAYEALRSAARIQHQPAEPGSPAVDVPADPADITDQHPLQLPDVRAGGVYLVSVGHFTVGWRTFADWSVRFETLAEGKLSEQGTFAVGMTRGALQSTTVAEIPAREAP
jgi:hypothetical protein